MSVWACLKLGQPTTHRHKGTSQLEGEIGLTSHHESSCFQDQTEQVDIGAVDKLMDDMADLQDESWPRLLGLQLTL